MILVYEYKTVPVTIFYIIDYSLKKQKTLFSLRSSFTLLYI